MQMPWELTVTDDIVNIGSSNGLVPYGTKPLPDPMLIQVHDATWHHKASIS